MAASDRIIGCWAMGLTQHKNAVANIQEVVNLLLLRGSIGKPGAGAVPGARPQQRAGRPHDGHLGAAARLAFLDALAKEFGFDPPREHGLDTVGPIKAMHAGTVKVFFALGGNFLSATPDTEYTAARPAELPAHRPRVDQAEPRPPGDGADGADPALPGPHRAGRAGGRPAVRHHRELDGRGADVAAAPCRPPSPQLLQRAGHRRPARAGRARREEPRCRWDELAANYDRIRDRIERVVPGFDDYNQRVRRARRLLPAEQPRAGRVPHRRPARPSFTVHPMPRTAPASPASC